MSLIKIDVRKVTTPFFESQRSFPRLRVPGLLTLDLNSVIRERNARSSHRKLITLKPELRSTKNTESTNGERIAENRRVTRWVSSEKIATASIRVLSCLSWTLHRRI